MSGSRPESLDAPKASCFRRFGANAGKLLELALVKEWCPRERIALLHAIINIKKNFLFCFVFGYVFCGLLPFFSYNSFLLIFFLLVFLLFCFKGGVLSIF